MEKLEAKKKKGVSNEKKKNLFRLIFDTERGSFHEEFFF